MAIQFECRSCGRALRARDEFAGKRAECPSCGAVSLVPQGGPCAVDLDAPALRLARGMAPSRGHGPSSFVSLGQLCQP